MSYSRPLAVLTASAVTIGMLLFTGGAAGATSESTGAESGSVVVVGAERVLGQPFAGPVAVSAPTSVHGVDADGHPLVFWMTSGTSAMPAMLQVTDVNTQKVVFRQRVASGTASSAITFSPADSTVYIAMATGEFYSWTVGDPALSTLATPIVGNIVASLTAADDGTIYGGTSPGGLIFAYDPTVGVVQDLGRVNDRATSVNSLSVDAQFLYVGSEPGAQLSRFDRVNNAVETLALPAELGVQTSVQDQSLIGDYLFARVQPSNSAVVFRTDDLTVQNVVPRISGRPISGVDPTDGYVYFRRTPEGAATAIFKYDLQTHTYASTGWAPNVFPRSFSFAELPDQQKYPGTSVILASTNGRIYTWNEQTRAGIYLGESTLHSVPKAIRDVGAVAGSTVIAATATGGLARIASDGTIAQLEGLSSVEKISPAGDVLYIGSKNGALRRFDTTIPWSLDTNPGPALSIGEGQDLPTAFLPLSDATTVAVGSVGTTAGGAISLWNPTTGAITVHRDPIAQQGIVSLAERNGIVYGGTAVRTGSTGTTAELFSFDTMTGEVGFHVAPVPNATSINGLTFDSDGVLWAVGGQSLFSFDVEKGEVLTSERLFSSNAVGLGLDRSIAVRDDGIYASVDGRLLRVDRDDWSAVVLADSGVSNLSETPEGNLVYARHGQVFLWDFELTSVIDPVVPTSVVQADPAGEGWQPTSVIVTLSTQTPRAQLEYSLDGADWVSYTVPVLVAAQGAHELTYRARAAEGHVERPRSIEFAIDSEAPVTSVRQVGNLIVLSGADGASGVISTKYRIGDGAWTDYAGAIRVSDSDSGTQLYFYSVDAAGLVEQERTHVVGTSGDAQDRIIEHGDQVQKVQSLASLTTTSPEGRPLGIYIVSGNANINAEFSVIDLLSGEPVLQTRIAHGTSSQRAIAESPVDGAIYFGTSDVGHIYRYYPGQTTVEYLAAVPRGELVWGMDIGEDGTVWFGTYSSGKLYSLDPVTSVITDHGQAVAGEQYIDSLAPFGDTIYVGTQANAKLAAFDRMTGTFTEIAMPEGHSGTEIGELDIRGSLMFVSTSSKIYVRNLESGEWVDQIDNANPRVSPASPHDADLVYARVDNQVHSYRMSTGELLPIGARPNAAPDSWNWLRIGSDDELLVMTYWNGGRTYGFSVTGGQGFYLSPKLMGAAAPLISLGHDTVGNVYSGAFLSPPGLGSFNPATGVATLLGGTSQVEGYGTFNDKLVFGRYPQGSLYLYDPAKPWDYARNPQEPLELGDEQSRPHGFVQLNDDTVVVATVPKPGTHGGALTLWQPELGTHTVYRNVVQDQTPSSIVLNDGIIYGGTSIEGGYGIDPVTTEPVLYAWDPATQTTLWTVPFPDAKTVAGLAIAPDGKIWAIVDGRRIVEFDPQSREVLRSIMVDESAAIERFGDNDKLLFDHGRLFASLANKLLVLDTVTEDIDVLIGAGSGSSDDIAHVTELTQDAAGDLYVIVRHTQLASYSLPDDVTAPTAVIDSREGMNEGVRVNLSATDSDDALPLVQTRLDGGDWQVQPLSAVVVVPYGSTLEYRAIDSAWNGSPVEIFTAPVLNGDQPTVAVGSEKVRRGAELVVSGSGYLPWSEVTISLKVGGVFATVWTDEAGQFDETVSVPSSARVGRNDVVSTAPGDRVASTKLVVQPR